MKSLIERKKSNKSKRMKTKDRVKVGKKVRAFRKEARRTARKLKKAGKGKLKRVKKDPVLAVPNSWPGKEKLLQEAQQRREDLLEERRLKREAARKKKQWEKAHPEAAAIKRARAEARAALAEEAAEKDARDAQSFAVQLERCVKRCNCIFQVLDARAPLASLSKAVEHAVVAHQDSDPDAPEKLMVYVLNKADLVPRANMRAWLDYLGRVLPDDPKRRIKRRVAAYSNLVVEAPGALLNLLQGVWLKSAQKHRVVACVVGFPFVGKHSIVRDLEVTSGVVSVHAAAQLPKDGRRIQGSKDVAFITLPRDHARSSLEPHGLDIIFKHPDANVPDVALMRVSDELVSAADAVPSGREQLCQQYRMPMVEGEAVEFLREFARKRSLLTKDADKAPDILAAAKAIGKDISVGRVAVCSAVPAVAEQLPDLPPPLPEAPQLHPVLIQLLSKLASTQQARARALPLAAKSFEGHDFVLTPPPDEPLSKRARKLAAAADAPAGAAEKYEFNEDDWSEAQEEEEEEEEEDSEESEAAPARPVPQPAKGQAGVGKPQKRGLQQKRNARAKTLARALGTLKRQQHAGKKKKRGGKRS